MRLFQKQQKIWKIMWENGLLVAGNCKNFAKLY